MIIAYINYPNSRFIIHKRDDCSAIRQHGKSNQRVLQINESNLSQELLKFEKGYKFLPCAAFNDMWLHIELGDPRYEEETILHIHKVLSKRYSRLKTLSYCGTCSG
jgi:hypothetical protein